jgi:hypothetical protein
MTFGIAFYQSNLSMGACIAASGHLLVDPLKIVIIVQDMYKFSRLFGPEWHSLRLLPFQGPKKS